MLLLLVCAATALGMNIDVYGDTLIHDPSGIVVLPDGSYATYGTQQGLGIHVSGNMVNWTSGGLVFNHPPSWIKDKVPANAGVYWAPDVLYINATTLFLYYAVSSWGSQNSCIGLASSTNGLAWTDRGPVYCTSPRVDYNAIDPHVFFDPSKRLWMVFGSYWTGIKLIELDPQTGFVKSQTIYSLATHEDAAHDCEASWIHFDVASGFYYLFVNWGTCCDGVNSTYNIRMGRSRAVTGPYVDASGVDMMRGGGTMFAQTEGRYIGPGHFGVYIKDGVSYLTNHYDNRDNNGLSTLQLRTMLWNGPGGWPSTGANAA